MADRSDLAEWTSSVKSDRKVELQPSSDVHQLWCDPPPTIAGEGFIPVTEVKLESSCRDGAGRLWKSDNGYLISARASFHTGLTAAVGEDYYGIAAEGILYSMRCQDNSDDERHEFTLPTHGALVFKFVLNDGGETVWSGTTTRHSHGKVRERAKRASVWFLHNGTPGALHGESMLKSIGFEVRSHLIAPDTVELDSILEEMKDGPPAHLIASGRASEAALELAQRVPQIQSVSVFSGSGLRFRPWVLEGEQLPHVIVDHSSLQPYGRPVLSTRTVYAEAVADRTNRDRGRIAVEKIECPLYLYSGADDQVGSSSAFSELAAQRRKQNGLEKLTVHRTFTNVGYDLGPELGLPGLPTTERTVSHESTGFRLALGGKMARQSRARRECWESLVETILSF